MAINRVDIIVRRDKKDEYKYRKELLDVDHLFEEARDFLLKKFGILVDTDWMEIEDPGDLPDVFVIAWKK
jgi:hypothetical protein